MKPTAFATSAAPQTFVSTQVPIRDAWRFFFPLAVATAYHWFLCFGMNFGLPVSRTVIGAAEIAVLALIASLGRFAFSSRDLGIFLGFMIYICALWVLRGAEVDLKPVRDILIAMIAFWYGARFQLTLKTLDTGFLIFSALILAIGIFEFTDTYAGLINTFTYYSLTGAIDPNNAMQEDQTVTLNGLRPEGIGRTLLPSILGQQRISSVFLEPVGMGNFGVIIAAWAFAKPLRDWKIAGCFLVTSLLLFILADSRFGIATILLMGVLRFALPGNLATCLAFVFPVFAALGTVVISMLTNERADNFAGRLAYSGSRLMELDALSFLGITRWDFQYFDTGYPYSITRFGLLMLIALWVAFFLVPARSAFVARLRVNISLYISLILCVSGTSAFAFKTSVFLWALFAVSSKVICDDAENDCDFQEQQRN